MQTVLFVSRMTLGDEVAVREIHERFPVEVLEAGADVERLLVFIGSGLYAMEITVADGDFQEKFHRFLNAPEVQQLFSELGQHIQDLPKPGQYTGDMPLATLMLFWQRPGIPDPTAV